MADQQEMSASEKKKEDWMNSKWRPMMGWMYMAVCGFDFMVAPILWSILQSISHGSVQTQWQPLTLQGAGLFHVAMGAVLGIAAYGRTQEKLNGANNGGIALPSSVPTVPTAPSVPTPVATPTVPAPSSVGSIPTPSPIPRPMPTPIPRPAPVINTTAADPGDPPMRNSRSDL
jgi:hypothetical protein